MTIRVDGGLVHPELREETIALAVETGVNEAEQQIC
jgi:hypothetical protein